MSTRAAVAAIVIAIVIVIVVAGLWMVGTPREARERRFDEQRLNDLRSIESVVTVYRSSRKHLPPDLAEITAWPDHPIILRDPETNAQYVYRVLDATAYELCATFAHSSADEPGSARGFWTHPAGPHCFRVMAR